MAQINLNVVDKVEILTLQDNYIDLTAMDNNDIVTRAMPLQDGKFKKSRRFKLPQGWSARKNSGCTNKTIQYSA